MSGPEWDDRGERGADDGPLVQAAARGSREALGRLFRRYAEDVYRAAYRITGTRADAEDTVQDVFVGLRRALGHYHEQGRFGGWLRQVTVRTALSRVRSRDRRAFEPLEEAELADRSDAADPVDRIEVARALEEMPASHRIVFLLKEVEGYDHAEVASLLSITVGASRVRLHRAWRFLETRVREGPASPPPQGDQR